MPTGAEKVKDIPAFEEERFLALVDNELAAEFQFLAGKLPDEDFVRRRVEFDSINQSHKVLIPQSRHSVSTAAFFVNEICSWLIRWIRSIKKI
jgi:hypothetical protein